MAGQMKMLMMGMEIHVSEVNQARPSYFFVRMLRNLVTVLRPPEGRLSSVSRVAVCPHA